MKFKALCIETDTHRYEFESSVGVVALSKTDQSLVEVRGGVCHVKASTLDNAFDLLEGVEKILTFVKE